MDTETITEIAADPYGIDADVLEALRPPPEPPPPLTLFERLREAQAQVSLRDEIDHWRNIIAKHPHDADALSHREWVQVVAVGLACTGYSTALRAPISDEELAVVNNAAFHVLEALRKEERRASLPSTPFNLIKSQTAKYANLY